MRQIVNRQLVDRKNAAPLSLDVSFLCASSKAPRLEIPATPLSTKLKAQTACLHAQTEVLLGLPDAIKTRVDYHTWLCQFLGLYRPIEHSMANFGEWGSHGLALPSPSHRDCLSADLATLGIDPASVLDAPSPMLPHLPTFAHALGALYVLEGSTLGGKFILRDIETRIGTQIAGATQFFGGRGAAVGHSWQTVKMALDAFGRDHPDLQANVAAGAEAVFRAMTIWFVPLRMTTACRP